MLIEHKIIGSKLTSFHNFSLRIENDNLIISPGSYYCQNKVLFHAEEETIILFKDNSNIWLTGEILILPD